MMSEKNAIKFVCRECGGNELGYQKYVKYVMPVTIKENDCIEYGQSVFDEDDYLCAGNGFVCMKCGNLIIFCGLRIETEQDLLDDLKMDPELHEQQQKNYEKFMTAPSNEQECWDEF